MPSPQPLFFATIAIIIYIASIIHVALTTVTAGATPFQAFLVVNTYAVLNMISTSALVVRLCLDYLQNSLCIPNAVSWVLVLSYFSPRVWDALGAVVAVPFQVVARIFLALHDYRKESEEKIAVLEKQLADIAAGRALPGTLITVENHTVEIEKASRDAKRWRSKVRNLQAANDALEIKAEYAQNELERFHRSFGAIQRYKLEEAHNTEVRRLRIKIEDQAKKIQQLEANVDLWKIQHQQHDCTLSSEGGRKLQDEIDALHDEIERLTADKGCLVKENGDLKTTIHKLQPQVLILDSMTEAIHHMAENNDIHVRFAVTSFVSSLLSHGTSLADLGINSSLFETYTNWATILTAGGNAPVVPVSGFRLKGSVFPLSGSFVSGGTVFGASMRLLDQAFASAQAPAMQSQTQALALVQLPPTPPQTPPPQLALPAPEDAGARDGGCSFGSFADLVATNKAEAAPQNASTGGGDLTVPRIVEQPPTPMLPSSSGNDVSSIAGANTVSTNTSTLGASTGTGTVDEEVINPDDFFCLGGEKSTTSQLKQKSTSAFGSSPNNVASANLSSFSAPAPAPQNSTPAPATTDLLQPSPNTFGFLSNVTASSGRSTSNDSSSSGALAGLQPDPSSAALAVNSNAPFGGAYINTSPPTNSPVHIGAPFGSFYSTNASLQTSFGSSQGSTQPFGSSFTNALSFGGSQQSNGFLSAPQNNDAEVQAKLLQNASPFGSLVPNNGSVFGLSGGFDGLGGDIASTPFGSSQNSAPPFSTSGGFGGQYNSMPNSDMMNSVSTMAPHGVYNGSPSPFGSLVNNSSGFGGSSGSGGFGTPSSFGQPSSLGQPSFHNFGGFGQSQASTFGQPSNDVQSNFGTSSGFGASKSSGFEQGNNASTFGTVSTWRSSDNADVPRNSGSSFTMIHEPPSATGAGGDDDADDRDLQLSGARSKKNPWR